MREALVCFNFSTLMLPRVAKSESRCLSMLHCKIDLARLKTALPVAIKAFCFSFGSFKATIACSPIRKMVVGKHLTRARERARRSQSSGQLVGRDKCSYHTQHVP